MSLIGLQKGGSFSYQIDWISENVNKKTGNSMSLARSILDKKRDITDNCYS